MGRTKRDGRIENRSNRSRLPFHREPYWTKLEPGRALGYRKTRGGAGTWVARLYCPEGQSKHRYRTLGTADDLSDADGKHLLSFAQAQATAREWFEEQLRINALALEGEIPHRGPFTIVDAMTAYLEHARHTYATTLILARVHLHIVAKQLGHGDTRMVERYYGHLTPSVVAEVIEELAPDLRLLDQPMIEPLLVSNSA